LFRRFKNRHHSLADPNQLIEGYYLDSVQVRIEISQSRLLPRCVIPTNDRPRANLYRRLTQEQQ
jgi:hypothetical protein